MCLRRDDIDNVFDKNVKLSVTIDALEWKIKKLEEQVDRMTNNCGVMKAYEKLLKEEIVNYGKLVEPSNKASIRDLPNLITITYDPSKFHHHIYSQFHQRQYILFIMAMAYNKKLIGHFDMCFEQHKSGVIHSHLCTDFSQYNVNKFKEFIVPYFTNKDLDKQFAIDIIMNWTPTEDYQNPKEYVQKDETKPEGEINYYKI